MALTNKGSKWEAKNSLYIILAFIPVLNSFVFFHMSSRVKNKKWSVLGWIVCIISMALLVATIIVPSIDNPNKKLYYHDIEESPYIYDYLTVEETETYKKIIENYDDMSYKNLDGWQKWSSDYEAWEERQNEWENTPEVIAQNEIYDAWEDSNRALVRVIDISATVCYFLFIFVAFIERPKYLKILEQSENRSSVTSRINTVKENVVSKDTAIKTKAPESSTDLVDINAATEEEITALQGLTIIDAKKAIAYRDEHNGFDNVDEFFTCINAKPHIVVALEKQLVIKDYKTIKAAKADNSGKRMLDL